jgi:tRNA-dihydrouridine synthase
MLPWFRSTQIPLYLAPMAGVTDSVFRRLCKEQGADVVVTEFVSADGILHRNPRTREMIAFRPEERPVGVQLFGADPEKMAEAARAVTDWVEPDFIDLNFGCPVNKVVCRHGGSALLRDCPLLQKVASQVVRALDPVPVTAKIRLGWDASSIRAVMTTPWLFRQIRLFLDSSESAPEPSLTERWAHVLRHCRLAVQENDSERFVISSMRSRLMAYSKGMPDGRFLREAFQKVTSIAEIETIASRHLEDQRSRESALLTV